MSNLPAIEVAKRATHDTRNRVLLSKTKMTSIADASNRNRMTIAKWLDGEHWDDDPLPAKPEPTARPSPSAWSRSQANQDANAALIARYAAEEAAENQSREGVLTC